MLSSARAGSSGCNARKAFNACMTCSVAAATASGSALLTCGELGGVEVDGDKGFGVVDDEGEDELEVATEGDDEECGGEGDEDDEEGDEQEGFEDDKVKGFGEGGEKRALPPFLGAIRVNLKMATRLGSSDLPKQSEMTSPELSRDR